MSDFRAVALLVFALGAGIFGFQTITQSSTEKPKSTPMPTPTGANEIIQEFPSNEAMKTAWKIQWAAVTGHGLYIKEAHFKRGPKEPWVQVLGDVRLAEMFVPYHSGSPRFWDVSYNFSLIPVGREEAGAFGKVLGTPPNVVAELRDRGIHYIDTGKGTKRGQSLVLWGCLDAANYRYVVEFGFQDDGVVTARVGSTGRNYASREFEGHMHLGLWRVDLNIDGPGNNTVLVMEHGEPDQGKKEKARTNTRPFNNGVEGAENWSAEKFSMLTVLNTRKKNQRGKPWAYDVAVNRMGVARHFGPEEEECTRSDFWVTKNRPNEMFYKKVPGYVKKGESILDTDVVLWISTACHHEPRSEDGELRGSTFMGATPIAWSGFELRPRNFFDRTPHYPYPAQTTTPAPKK